MNKLPIAPPIYLVSQVRASVPLSFFSSFAWHRSRSERLTKQTPKNIANTGRQLAGRKGERSGNPLPNNGTLAGVPRDYTGAVAGGQAKPGIRVSSIARALRRISELRTRDPANHPGIRRDWCGGGGRALNVGVRGSQVLAGTPA